MNYYIEIINGLEYWFREDSLKVEYICNDEFRLVGIRKNLGSYFETRRGFLEEQHDDHLSRMREKYGVSL